MTITQSKSHNLKFRFTPGVCNIFSANIAVNVELKRINRLADCSNNPYIAPVEYNEA